MRLFRRAVAVALLVAGSATADEAPVVVELFTSQGCNACPPADDLLGELAGRSDVIALGLHVDYWNYLGWRDVFSSPGNTRRQKGYSESLGNRTVFTPQMVIGGATSEIGSRRAAVLEDIALAAARAPLVDVRITATDGLLRASVSPRDGFEGEADVLYFIYEPPQTVRIASGENRGRAIVYHNAVRVWMRLGRFRGEARDWRTPAPDDARGVAVVVQRPDQGPIIGAARFEFDAEAALRIDTATAMR